MAASVARGARVARVARGAAEAAREARVAAGAVEMGAAVEGRALVAAPEDSVAARGEGAHLRSCTKGRRTGGGSTKLWLNPLRGWYQISLDAIPPTTTRFHL